MKDKFHVVGYGDMSVEATALTADICLDGNIHLELYADESKALRKMLKRAEKAMAEARR